ncbi:MAG: serine/threonine protein kinase [Gammaproteobacteria bacterium]|nr:serine/threonine protein kinase [Gammaproteobacteria bacterium]
MTDDFKTGGGLDALQGLSAGDRDDPVISKELGDYRVLRLIAEGGMGRVYLAERTDGSFERKVALKLAASSAYSNQLRARFQTEQGVLASLNHPSIAQLYDARVSDEGWPYFVMEYVDGGPITDFCEANSLSVRQRIRLLIDVVDAVAFAHARLIVHRDIKPSNVLVSADGRPKLLDFGIAKLLEDEASKLTQAAPMTPRYASPEQLLHQPITTAVDTYQLGLLAYEVLTGETLNAETTLAEAVDRARNNQAIEVSASVRQILPREVIRIIEHCLRADAADRYRDAGALRDDLQAYLDGYPVRAVGQSATYRLSKALRRNWLPATMTAVIILGTTAALVQSTIQRNRLETTQATLEKVTEFQQNMLLSIDTAAMGDGISEDLTGRLLEALAEPGERQMRGRVASALDAVNFTDIARQSIDRNILAEAVATIDESFEDDVIVASALRDVVSEVHEALGMLDKSLPLRERVAADLDAALGPEADETIAAQQMLATIYFYIGMYEKSSALFKQTYDLLLETRGPDHKDTIALYQDYGNSLIDLNELDEAERILVDALERSRRVYGERHWSTGRVMNNLGYLYQLQGHIDEVVPLYAEVLELRKDYYGPEHVDTLDAASNLATAYNQLGRYEDSEALYRETIAIERRVHGDKHPSTLITMSNLASSLRDQGRFAEAAEIAQQVAVDHEAALGPDHPNSLIFRSNYALVLVQIGRPDEAEAMFAELIERARTVLPTDHEITGVMHARYGRSLRLQGKFKAAEAAILEGRRILIDVVGLQGQRRRDFLQFLVDLYDDWGRSEAKQSILDEIDAIVD